MPLMTAVTGPIGANVPNVTETVVATVSGVTLPRPGMPVALSYAGVLLTGAGTTAVTIRCRRGIDTTGTVVGAADVPNEAASAAANLAAAWVDQPGELANASYVVTVQQTAAGAAGTSQVAAVVCLVGTPL
jgi:hypothetical protein